MGATAALISIPAQAAPSFVTSGVALTYTCVEPPYAGGESDFILSLTASVLVVKGQTINLTASIQSADGSAVAVPAQGVSSTLDINVSGAVTTTVTATGLTDKTAVAVGEQVLQTGGTASLPASTAGYHAFEPGEFVTTTWMDTVLDCTPDSTAVAARTQVLPLP